MTRIPAPRRVGQADIIHHDGYDDAIVSPFVPAMRVVSPASLVFISGVTGAPVYHDHPHVPEVFDAMPLDAGGMVNNGFDHLDRGLAAAGCGRSDVVNLIRFFTDVEADQDVVNAHQKEWFGGHIPTSTTVEVTRLATDPRLRFEFHVVAAAPADASAQAGAQA
ncbi:RidA family protein [Microbacterium sp. zg.Y818]|uniref:RidA family protein n=1 Tax=Microbacterium sp. zg.Y818 TaxID=2969412 RepID=UPI00214AB5E2|nr:Rid family hydrolase [Microbacterium sp. zg.Y818]MCR2799561.1 Rid family hydrolase [Microbacterium sp. zg.Y818]